MTQEEIKDLCARLPYGVTGVVPVEMFNGNYDLIDGSAEYDTMNLKVRLEGINVDTGDIEVVNKDDRYSMYDLTNDYFTVEDFTPYLRPMSSMTEEERDEIEEMSHGWFYVNEDGEIFPMGQFTDSGEFEDAILPTLEWLNKKMFDYRGLIPMGLALEAPTDMYQEE